MDLLSVIIPVYKVEKYLDECVFSIVQQSYRNLEIILIDDGSPDESGQKCDEWAKKDNRVKVIHTENGGAGKARNIGFEASTGKYISFVDSDDYLSPYMYEILLEYLKNDIDIVECDYIPVDDSDYCFRLPEDGIKSIACLPEESIRGNVQDKIFKQVIWNKVYDRNIVKGIPFPEGKTIDDEFWTYQVLGRAKRLTHVNACLYAYRQQDNSVMHMSFSLQRLQAIEAKVQRLEYIKNKFPTVFEEAHENLWLTCLYMGQMSMKYLPKEQVNEAITIISEILKEYSLSIQEIKKLSFLHKIWCILSKISVKLVCAIRNLFKVGI